MLFPFKADKQTEIVAEKVLTDFGLFFGTGSPEKWQQGKNKH